MIMMKITKKRKIRIVKIGKIIIILIISIKWKKIPIRYYRKLNQTKKIFKFVQKISLKAKMLDILMNNKNNLTIKD